MAPVPHCPHCLLPIAAGERLPFPPQALRCPNCRLIIGAGRARAEATGEDGDARSRGSAAGVLANAARRAGSAPGDRQVVLAALRTVAAQHSTPVERLRMLDYQEAADASGELPGLSTVLATFTTWKVARVEAAVSSSAVDDAATAATVTVSADQHPDTVVDCPNVKSDSAVDDDPAPIA